MYGYSKDRLLLDGGMFVSAIILTYLIGLTQLVDDQLLSGFFKFMLYVVDFTILLAILVGNSLKDGIVVFPFLRIVGLVYAGSFGLWEVLAVPILGFVVFRGGCMAVNGLVGLDKVSPKTN